MWVNVTYLQNGHRCGAYIETQNCTESALIEALYKHTHQNPINTKFEILEVNGKKF